MDVTLHLGSWIVPTVVTIVAIIAVMVAFAVEKPGGDYSFPILAPLLFACGFIATIVAWTMFFTLQFFS